LRIQFIQGWVRWFLNAWISLTIYIDVIVGKALAMLGFIRRVSGDPYTFKALFMSLVRPKLEYGLLFYDEHERVQQKFNKFASRGLGWTDLHDLPRCEDKCALLHIDTLFKRCTVAWIMLYSIFCREEWLHRACCPWCI
jgi:hypothetical protein